MNNYQVVARNFSESSENQIHSDEIAKKFGFKGALVPGVAVYGHLTYPLVERFGESWLQNSVGNLRLLKPAYHNDLLDLNLTATNEPDGAESWLVTCNNADGELLATLNSQEQIPAEHNYSELFDRAFKKPERVVISWDTVEPNQPFVPWEFELSQAENSRYTTEVDDKLAVYQQKVHPHLICSLANTALMNEYIMPTWIHVGTETTHHKALNVGDNITIRSVPIEKWQKKGHEFIRLYVSFWRQEELTTQMLHTAIFKVAT